MESGIGTYHEKLAAAVNGGKEFYRMGRDTLEIRSRKSLLEKVSWYKGPAWTRYLKGKPIGEDPDNNQVRDNEQHKQAPSRGEGGQDRQTQRRGTAPRVWM